MKTTGGMLHQLIVLSASSRFDFSNSNYNYDNTNTNVSSHLCKFSSTDPANKAKNHDSEKSVGTDGKTIF
jgi:hypothetical protein